MVILPPHAPESFTRKVTFCGYAYGCPLARRVPLVQTLLCYVKNHGYNATQYTQLIVSLGTAVVVECRRKRRFPVQ